MTEVDAIQDRAFPTRAVRVIDPFGAGGGPDIIGRAIAERLSEMWGQRVIVENHPGAGSTAAPALVAKALADGYTLLINTSAHAYSAAFSSGLSYDPLLDFVPVAGRAHKSALRSCSRSTVRDHQCPSADQRRGGFARKASICFCRHRHRHPCGGGEGQSRPSDHGSARTTWGRGVHVRCHRRNGGRTHCVRDVADLIRRSASCGWWPRRAWSQHPAPFAATPGHTLARRGRRHGL